jgi:Vps5 C terminal like.
VDEKLFLSALPFVLCAEYLKVNFLCHSKYIIIPFQWEAKVERGQEEFDNISKMIKKEMERFEGNRVKDFKAIIIQYLENLMTHQQQVRDVRSFKSVPVQVSENTAVHMTALLQQ